MNIKLPWDKEPGLVPFAITMALMVGASAATLGFFRYKKWL
jgi:Mg2+ and Co2+ transporter CorA